MKHTYILVDDNGEVAGFAYTNKPAADNMAGYIPSNGRNCQVVQIPYANSQKQAQKLYEFKVKSQSAKMELCDWIPRENRAWH